MKSFFTSLLILLASLTVSTAQNQVLCCYKHYTAVLSGGDTAVIDLIFNNMKVSGFYYVPGKPDRLFLTGKVELSYLQLFNDEDNKPFFKGDTISERLKGTAYLGKKKFKGVWLSGTSDCVDFDVFCNSKSYPLNSSKADSPSYEIEFAYLQPKTLYNIEISRDLKIKYNQKFFPEYQDYKNPDAQIIAQTSNLVSEYIKNNSSADEDVSSELKFWDYSLKIVPEFNYKGFVTVRADYSSYSGGAHGMYGVNKLVIDFNSNKILSLYDIFDKKDIPELKQLIYNKLKTILGNELYVDFNQFEMPDNFGITDSEINFVFQPYEVASFAQGPVTCSLKYEEVASLIKQDSSLNIFSR